MHAVPLILAAVAVAYGQRHVDPDAEQAFLSDMSAFTNKLSMPSGPFTAHPHHHLASPNQQHRTAIKECSREGIQYRFERNLSPGHARSSLYLVRSVADGGRRRWVRKVHGSQHSYDIEMHFYERVRHQLVSAAVCWEPQHQKQVFMAVTDSDTDTDLEFVDHLEVGGEFGDIHDIHDIHDIPDTSDTNNTNNSHHTQTDTNDNITLTDSDSDDKDTTIIVKRKPPKAKQKRQTNVSSKYALLIEYVKGGQSGDFMYELGYQLGNDGTALFQRLVGQLIDAIDHVHQKGMVHGDIKPENVLVTESDPHSPSPADIRLIDFDLSADSDKVRVRAGTRTTMSPEVGLVVEGPINEASDWWSVGATVLLWTAAWRCGQLERAAAAAGTHGSVEAVCNYRPFQFVRQEGRMIVRPIPNELKIPVGLQGLLRLLLNPNPAKRRFTHPADLQFLRHQFQLKSNEYSVAATAAAVDFEKSVDTHPSQHDQVVVAIEKSVLRRRIRTTHMHAQTDRDLVRCDHEECIKDGQEPLFIRRGMQFW